MLKELEAHLRGLIKEIEIQGDNPSQISISIDITDRIQTMAFSADRIYSSTPIKGDEEDYIFCSLPRDQFTESFLAMEEQ